MKASEFKKLIREEVGKVLKEEKREAITLTYESVIIITLTYNTDPDDLKYVKKVLATAGVEAIVAAGTFDDEVEIIIKPNLKQKAIKALQGDGFDI